ncbi:hypothetical protein JW949_00605 [Candidatus Woesearchaeota archaeon]|nr:hypothetical protein [Candidatus Woesearchaeota archaeon]
MKCSFHNEEAKSYCSWCGKPICEKCINSSKGKKYCPDCWKKVSKQGVFKYLDKMENLSKKDKKTTSHIRNMDYSLDDDKIDEIKKDISKRYNIDKKKLSKEEEEDDDEERIIRERFYGKKD